MIEAAIGYVILLGIYTAGAVFAVRHARREVVQSLTQTMKNLTVEIDKITAPAARSEDSIFYEGEDFDPYPATIPFRKHGTR